MTDVLKVYAVFKRILKFYDNVRHALYNCFVELYPTYIYIFIYLQQQRLEHYLRFCFRVTSGRSKLCCIGFPDRRRLNLDQLSKTFRYQLKKLNVR
jgi:hypothetical protein